MMMMLYDTCNYSLLEMPIRSFTLAITNTHLSVNLQGTWKEIQRKYRDWMQRASCSKQHLIWQGDVIEAVSHFSGCQQGLVGGNHYCEAQGLGGHHLITLFPQ